MVCARFARNEGLPFADILTEVSIREVLDAHNVTYRDRVFSPVTTIWGFLSQVLSEDHSCRDAVSRIIAHRVARGDTACSPCTASYCNARSRMVTGVLSTLAKRTAEELHASMDDRGNGTVVPCSSSMVQPSRCQTLRRINRCIRNRLRKRKVSVFLCADRGVVITRYRRLPPFDHRSVPRQGHRRKQSLSTNVRHAQPWRCNTCRRFV